MGFFSRGSAKSKNHADPWAKEKDPIFRRDSLDSAVGSPTSPIYPQLQRRQDEVTSAAAGEIKNLVLGSAKSGMDAAAISRISKIGTSKTKNLQDGFAGITGDAISKVASQFTSLAQRRLLGKGQHQRGPSLGAQLAVAAVGGGVQGFTEGKMANKAQDDYIKSYQDAFKATMQPSGVIANPATPGQSMANNAGPPSLMGMETAPALSTQQWNIRNQPQTINNNISRDRYV